MAARDLDVAWVRLWLAGPPHAVARTRGTGSWARHAVACPVLTRHQAGRTSKIKASFLAFNARKDPFTT